VVAAELVGAKRPVAELPVAEGRGVPGGAPGLIQRGALPALDDEAGVLVGLAGVDVEGVVEAAGLDTGAAAGPGALT